MKKSVRIDAAQIKTILVAWLIGANLCEQFLFATHWWMWQILLFVCLAGLPGTALLRVLRPEVKGVAAHIAYVFGMSLLTIMLSGLAANQLLFALGDHTPLDAASAFGIWNVVTLLLIVWAWRANKQPLNFVWQTLNKPIRILAGLSLGLPCLVIFGAIRLNNGLDASLSMAAIAYAAGLLVAAIWLRRRLPDGMLAWLIFIVSISVLLMTSLRGWNIVGHDIEREFRVYTLAHNNLHWNIADDRDPYNACLSITILPQMFSAILSMSGVLVFKILLQIIFAICPVVIYTLIRRYAGKLAALAGCIIFICYPTFINDSAMLTRQGIAYTFFGLALLTLSWAQTARGKWLFLLCALGAVLSHYSTAYMFVGLFTFAVLCKFGVRWWFRWRRKNPPKHMERSALSVGFAVLLFLMTFGWYTQITSTANGLFDTLRSSVAQIPSLFSSDNKSSDTSAALIFAGNKSQVGLYQSYITNTMKRSVNTSGYDLTDDNLPLTPLGKKMEDIGIHTSIISEMRQDFAKILQVLAVLGVVYVTYHLLRRKISLLGLDFVCLSLASLLLLAMMVVLPVLSVSYGILRAFQQALIFLVIPIVLLLARLINRLSRVRTIFAAAGTAGLFFLFTGFFGQLVGGTSPSLSLNNAGLYYGLYYHTAADNASFSWMKNHIPKHSDVRAANFNRALMDDPAYPFGHSGILPTQVTPTTYVYLDEAQTKDHKLYTYYQASPLTLTFPTTYYQTTKDCIFSTTTTQVCR